MSQNATLLFELNGQSVDFPLTAFDLKIKSNFINDNIQGDIEIEDLDVYKEYTHIIDTHIAQGKYYKGLPIKIKASSDLGVVDVFNGYINLPKLHEILNDGTYKVGVIKKDGLNNLQERLEAITWTMLEAQGDISSNDYTTIDYVVEKSNPALEILMLTLVIYVIAKETIETVTIKPIDSIQETTTAAIPSVGAGAVVNVGAILKAVLSIILQILYIALILVAIVGMAKRLFELLITPKREHKSLNYRRGMQIIANRLGLTFYSTITELDNYHYLPSNTGGKKRGQSYSRGTAKNAKESSKTFEGIARAMAKQWLLACC